MGWSIVDMKALEDAVFELKLTVAKHLGIRTGMTAVDVGCGQGGFTAAIATLVGETGKVLAIDVTDDYVEEFNQRLNKYGVKSRVTFTQTNGTNLEKIIPDGTADAVVSFRLLEELKNAEEMPKIIAEMARVTKNGGKICLTELSTLPRNKAEEVYIRLHKESGDCFFRRERIVKSMKECGLKNVSVEKFDTDIWFSPALAKQDLGFAQVWFDKDVEKNLGRLIDLHGMKYPELLIFSGYKPAES